MTPAQAPLTGRIRVPVRWSDLAGVFAAVVVFVLIVGPVGVILLSSVADNGLSIAA